VRNAERPQSPPGLASGLADLSFALTGLCDKPIMEDRARPFQNPYQETLFIEQGGS
jgi:hypothetical protein